MYKDLKQGVDCFYKTSLGETVSQQLMNAIKPHLGDITGQNILIIGPKISGIEQLELKCSQVQYRNFGGSQVFPFSDDSFRKVIILHTLEFTQHIKGFLREVWRVTAPEGKAIFIVSNRLGLLVRSDKTPFGYGQPFTRKQIKNLLSENSFQLLGSSEALCMPVWSLSYKPKVMKFMDKMGQLLWPELGGVFLVVGKKTIYALDMKDSKSKPPLAVVITPL